MARSLRIQYPGAFYHVINRGNARQPIFRDDIDRKQFLKILSQSVEIYKTVIHGFVLMENHYHLLVETPLGNLAESMRYFTITYTSYFNRRHQRVGHLFQGRYKSVLIEQEKYLAAVSQYIHLNPVKTDKLSIKPAARQLEYLRGYSWSSLPGIFSAKARHDFVEYSLVLADYGGDNADGRQAYMSNLAEGLSQDSELQKKIIGQCLLGGDDFVSHIQQKYGVRRKNREIPAVRRITRHLAPDHIIATIARGVGCEPDELLKKRGRWRWLAMDLLYSYGGMNNREIGELMGVDYSTVSQGRKRLRQSLADDEQLKKMTERMKSQLSIIKI